ncbi:MAG: CDP-diacylglycerol--glycerol-3-phosphate 3-phosphatidyltransferase [Bacteroidota bacterium]
MQRLFSPPNQLTFLRILLTPVFVALFLSSDPVLRWWSIPVFVLAMLTDWYDGYVARRWGFVTRWGSFLDPFADKVLISATLLAFLVVDLVPAWTVWTIVVRDIGITFLRSYSELKGKAFDTSMMAKSKTFLQFVVVHYVLLLYVARTSLEPASEVRAWAARFLDHSILDPLMALTALVTLATGVMYLFSNRDTLRQLYG